MSKFLQQWTVFGVAFLLSLTASVSAQQLPNKDFEDWNGAQFNGSAQPASWNASNVDQSGKKVTFGFKDTGRNGGSCIMTKGQWVGAMGIGANSPGYFTLGKPWTFLSGLDLDGATGGTAGGINWTHLPDTMSVWIKRTGDNWSNEDFTLLYYAWTGTSKATSYKNKNNGCTNVSSSECNTNEESDIRLLMDGNECGTPQKATQVAEGYYHARAQYNTWTNIKVPIYYFNNTTPSMANVVFAASNYPNFRTHDGIYENNALYVDDVEMIYASTIDKIYLGDEEWTGFNPKSSEIQVCEMDESATAIPTIKAFRGVGTLINQRGTKKTVSGRELKSSEMTISCGDLSNTPTVITVKSADNKSTTVYRIQFKKAASSNARLASIAINGTPLTGFTPTRYNYTFDLPYGTTEAPVVTAEGQEIEQKIDIQQPTSVNGTATITVTAANGTTTATYSVAFKVGLLADNTLKMIYVNDKPVPGFTPTQTVYKVSLPTTTMTMPNVRAESAYPEGEQTIVYTAPESLDGGQYQISVTTPGNPVAKVYKLNFKLEASSYKYLADLQVAGDQVDHVNPAKEGQPTVLLFKPEQMDGYVAYLKMGTTALPQIVATPGDDSQTITKEEGGLDGITRINVKAGNGDQAVYKLKFETLKSDNCLLNGILIGGQPLEGFEPNVFKYTHKLPLGTDVLPSIEPIAGDEYQTIQVTTAGVNGTTRITVTASSGKVAAYLIDFSVDAYTDNTLASLEVEGFDIGFEPEKNEYYVNLPQGTTELPKVSYTLQDERFQTVNERPLTNGLTGDWKITVRPQSGASRTYIIHFTLATSSNTALKMIYFDGVPMKCWNGTDSVAFDPEVLEYTHILPAGESKLPKVTYDPEEASQRVLPLLENRVLTLTVTAESGAKREYKITFEVVVSANAYLDMIYLDEQPIEDFEPSKVDYHVQLDGPTCPAITVDKAQGQQVTITAPYAAGTAYIKVIAGSGDVTMYSIEFEAGAVETARLKDILVNGVSLEGFDPKTLHYTAEYSGQLPLVEGVPENDQQAVQVLWKAQTAYIYVTDKEGNTAAYSIAFTRRPSQDNTLLGIYENFGEGEQLIDGFNADQHNYSYELEAGSTLPVLTYKAATNAQVVFFGQLEYGKWGIVVEAEDGTPAEYTVAYTVKPYDDATLIKLFVNGILVEGFDPNLFNYIIDLDNGADMPQLSVESRLGQTILMQNCSLTRQEVTVYAENGAHNTYSITYTRKQSKNALLADILIDGVSLEGFNPNTFQYEDSLNRFEDGIERLVVPNVYPIGQLPNQTITTTYGRLNGTTLIHVIAQDGETEATYEIAFPVRKVDNNKLAMLDIQHEEAMINFKPDVTDYEVTLPFEDIICPPLIIQKGDARQRVDIISRPIGETTQVIVYAENGAERTYNILFKRSFPTAANELKSLTIGETNKKIDLNSNENRVYKVALPYNSRSLTVNYTKNYDEQTVFIQPGGVLDTTFITVKANRGDEEDLVYKLVPVVDQQNPAVLDVLRIDDVLLSGFDKNRFTYIYNVADVGQVSQITYEMGEKVRCSTRQNLWSWEATVTASGYTNTYKIFFHYPNEKLPNNGDFTKRVQNAKGTSYKPEGWNATNDFVSGYYSADYVSMNDGGPVQLYNHGHTTLGWAAVYGCAPAMLNLAEMTASHVVSGNSKTIAKGEIDFHNTPDGMETKFAYPEIDNDDKGALIRCRFVDNYNQEHYWDVTQKSKQSNPTVYKQNFDLSGVPVKAYDVIVDASSAYLNGGSGDKYAKMQVYYVHFLYNSTPKAVTVNGIEGKLNNKVFTVTLDDPEDVNIRSYEFNGEVVDQAQILTWGAPQKEGNFSVRTATIRNFAEDGSYTDGYSLQVKRPLDTRKELAGLYVDAESLTGFAPSKKEYTVALPAYRYYFPDVQPVPASSRQHVTTAYNEADSTMTISVTSEIGETNRYTVRFVTEYSSDVTLTNIAAEGLTYNPDKHEYDLIAENMPEITFVKKSDLQAVSLINGVLHVTAEDGVTTGSYSINRVDPVYAPVGGIEKFVLNDAPIQNFGGDNTTREAAKPDNAVLFTRANATDTVVFVQRENQMEWFVPGIDQVYTWTFKKDGELSDNTNLNGLLLNGEAYADFMPSETSYFFTSDETLIVEAVLAEETQTLNTEITTNGDTIHYSMEVTAENGETKTYDVFVSTPKSGNNMLAAILLDDELMDDFAPEITNYTYIIPLPEDGIKRAEPQMPSITYIAGQEGQIITLERGKLNIDPTTIKVLSQDGKGEVNEYIVMIESAKSHCADLTGITVNGVALDHFEPGRHYYSTTLTTSENIVVDYMTDDRFQTNVIKDSTVIDGREYIYTVYVTAEDGHTSRYEVDIYIENQSNDAQLANILLDDKELVNFERALNKDLAFDPGQNNYIINVPAGTAVWPAVSAQLKMDGQQVDIIHKGKDSVVLHVIAVDKVTTNDYTLHFIVPKSKNTDLEMIYIDGKPLEGFDKDRHSYTYRLPIGKKAEKNVVEVVGQKAEDVQYIDPVEWNDEDAPKTAQATLRVYAEDEEVHSIDYDILFIATTSSIDTLAMIYADGDSLEGFDPHIYYYEQTLPVGTDAFPTLDADEGDPYQTLVLDTVSSTKNSLVRQFIVTALNGQEATYTVAYNIAVSAVDTLAMIFVNGPQLAGFKSNVYEYFYPFTAEEAKDLKDRVPVTCTPGDLYQDTSIVYLPETITGKTLGYKTVITATAQTGAQRIYTIHYPVSLSNDSTLEMIYINGEKIKDFSELLFSYKHEIGLDDALPVVTFDKKEEKQNVVPKIENDIVRLLVTAEDGVAKSEYVIAFNRQKSAVITLKEIILAHNGVQLTTSEFPYRPDYFEYTVNLPYDGSKELMQQLPEISWIKADEEQTVITETVELPNGDVVVVIHVIAPDGETPGDYSLTFHFLKPNDATLRAIYIRGVALADFLSEETEYTYSHPFGATQADFFGLDAVTYDLSDPLAQASMSIDENGTVSIHVIAQDPNYYLTYYIRQVTGADNDNTLKMIWLDEVEMSDFDPQVTFYTYYLREGFDAPNVTALANSLNAKGVSIGIAVAGDTCKVICTAADNSKRTYRIFFAISDIKDALTPTENDVIIKRVAGTNQLFIASLRQNVAFALYDHTGRLVHFESSVPAADPNDVDVFSDIYGHDVLSHVSNLNAGKLIDIVPGQIYIYGFYTSNKRFKSGKIRALPIQ